MRPERRVISACEPTRKTIHQEKTSTTTVRIAVASVEFTFFMPTLASTAVIPAKNAEPRANPNQSIARFPFLYGRNR